METEAGTRNGEKGVWCEVGWVIWSVEVGIRDRLELGVRWSYGLSTKML